MKKIIASLLLLFALAATGAVAAQNVKFKNYFTDATLRINYLRVGNRQHDSICMRSAEGIPIWAGSLTKLLDPFDNGKEYRDTPQGADSIASFQEVVRLPWPKKPVDICFQQRGTDQKMYTQLRYRFDPDSAQAQLRRQSKLREAVDPIKLQYKGNPHKKIDVVIVPEGYGPADSLKMVRDLHSFCDYLLGQEPFRSRAADFNVWGVPSMGEATGITDPGKSIRVNSLVGSSYNTFGADRYLMTMQLFRLHDAIGSIPFDHIIIMANSTTYGGGAIYNFYAMSSLNEMAYKVLPHELGHSIGGLADEYVDEDLSYGDIHALSQEPVEPNITTLVDFSSKWQALLPAGTPVPTPADESVPRTENGPLGVYEGAGYHAHGIYRPTMRCMMRDYAPFCPVCSRRLNAIFDLYTR